MLNSAVFNVNGAAERGTVENGSLNTLADYYWRVIRETPTGEYKKQKKK